MVAPVQGSTGNHTQNLDYLLELSNFYAKPENEGKQAQFVAPNGEKFDIDSASYLAQVNSNFNTGKLDGGADLGLSEHDKAKTNAKDKSDENKTDGTKSSDSSDEGTLSKGKEMKSGLPGIGNKSKEEGAAIANKSVETKNKNQAQAEATQIKTKDTFEKMGATTDKLQATSVQLHTKAQTTLQKAKKFRADKAKKNAEALASKDAEKQSSGLGFEGKLMTSAPASSGGNNAAQNKAWEDTMKGKINLPANLAKEQVPKLIEVKAAGEKAAIPIMDQTKAQVTGLQSQGDGSRNEANGKETSGWITSVTTAVTLTLGIIQCCTPVTALTGVVTILGALYSGFTAYKDFKESTAKREAAAETYRAADKAQAEGESSAGKARREAITLAVESNNKIMKANASLNKTIGELSAGMSNSEISGTNIDGMDQAQIDVVKANREREIRTHEDAHAAVCGGSVNIKYDANGIAMGGYVDIEVPSVDENNLEGTIEKAQMVIDAALAPSNPSGQDQNIAAQAKSVLEEAQSKLEEKTSQSKKTKKEEVKEEPKKEVKDELKK